MSKSIFAKAAAVVFGAATLCALSIGASAVTNYDPQVDAELTQFDDQIADGVANVVAGRVVVTKTELAAAKEAGNTELVVEFPVYVINNTGYCGSGVKLVYDNRLSLAHKANGKPDTKGGDAADDLTLTFAENDGSTNEGRTILAAGTIGDTDDFDDGRMYTAKFGVPVDATAGEYKMEIEITKWVDSRTDPVAYNEVSGWIRVEGDEPIVTSTTTTTDVTTTTTTTTSGEAGSTTTTTTTSAKVGSTTTTTTSGKNGADGTTTTTKASGNAGNKDNNNKTDATKTGDAGVGVAAAALLLAAGTAVVATKKKND